MLEVKSLVLLIVVIQFFVVLAISKSLENFDKDFGVPVTGKVYFGIAIPNSGQSYSRAFNKTLINITQSYLSGFINKNFSYNISLETLLIELPEKGRFSSTLLERLCDSFEKKQVVAVLVVGATPAAFTVTLTARHAGIPVLWARGQSEFLPGFRNMENSPLEVHLAPTGRELVQALRGLLLQAHWHTFTVLADSASATALSSPELWNVLQTTPLRPTLVPLPNFLRPQSLFRKLADISRSTRGVVILCSDSSSAIKILDDAKRLNMMDGHFVWIWIDTAGVLNIGNFTEEVTERSKRQHENEGKHRANNDANEDEDYSQYIDDDNGDRELNTREKRNAFVQSDLNNMHLTYFFENDHYLLLNRNEYGVDSSKLSESKSKDGSRSRTIFSKLFGARIEKKSNLPAGLLSIKPLPIKIDRHLVKGAVKLLTSALLSVVSRSPAWLVQNIDWNKFATSCWHQDDRDLSFSIDYSRELKLACTEALSAKKVKQEIGVDKVDKSLVANFEILNLVPENNFSNRTENTENIPQHTSPLKWKRVGLVSGRNVRLDTIIWPGGDLSVAAVSIRARTVFRVITAIEPPFVMESELDEDGQCLRGLPCHRVLTADKDNLTLVFNEMKRIEEKEEDGETEDHSFSNDYNQFVNDYSEDTEKFLPFQKFKYKTNCCYGLSMDLLENIAQELEFDFRNSERALKKVMVTADLSFALVVLISMVLKNGMGDEMILKNLKKDS